MASTKVLRCLCVTGLAVVLLQGAACNSEPLPTEESGMPRDLSIADRAAPPDLRAGDLVRSKPDLAPFACRPVETSTLGYVAIRFLDDKCSFTLAEAAAGIEIQYSVDVSRPVSGVIATPQDSGQCTLEGASGLYPFEEVSGNGQRYCLCDTGRCAPPVPSARNLIAARNWATFKWDGRNWNGPSDTGNPKGDPFPPGVYELKVSAVGEQVTAKGNVPYEVKLVLPILLNP